MSHDVELIRSGHELFFLILFNLSLLDGPVAFPSVWSSWPPWQRRVHSLEAELEHDRHHSLQLEILKKDKARLLSQLTAQESVIDGLRAERRIWGQELAQQGGRKPQGHCLFSVAASSDPCRAWNTPTDSVNFLLRISSAGLPMRQSYNTLALWVFHICRGWNESLLTSSKFYYKGSKGGTKKAALFGLTLLALMFYSICFK